MIRLEVPGELRFRGVVMRTVAAACRLARAGARDEQADVDEADPHRLDLSHELDAQLVSAVSEAYNNIVLHAYAGREPDPIGIEIDIDEQQIVVRLADMGVSLDPDSAPQPDLDALPEGGLGLYIIRSFVDRFDYAPGTPNTWTLFKSL